MASTVRKTYANTIRTEAKLKNTLLQMLGSKGVGEITICELVNEAELDRGTFYLHYKNLSELVDDIQKDIIKDAEKTITKLYGEDLIHNIDLLFDTINNYIEENREMLGLICDSDCFAKLLTYYQDTLVKLAMRNIFWKDFVGDKDHFKYEVKFIAGGIVSVYREYLRGELNISIEQIESYCKEKIMAPVNARLEKIKQLGLN